MKKIILLGLVSVGLFSINAQTNVNLKLNHHWNGSTFNYGQQYTDGAGKMVEISRVQYYLSGFNLTHDGGQNLPLTGTYVLASGNIISYPLGSYAITNLEGINFDLGIDAATNHLDPNMYAPSDPLAIQNPSMHWGWSSGYMFLVLNGLVDSDGDNVPDKAFQFSVVADDSYLQNISALSTSGTNNGSDLDVTLEVNIADWLVNVDLVSAGSNHGVFPVNGVIMNNTNPQSVFTLSGATGIETSSSNGNNVYFNYTLPYAPTIFYKFPNSTTVDLTIMDINGKLIWEDKNLKNEGNYFIKKELPVGTYFSLFQTNDHVIVTEKFIITQ